jgi:hypothetical protein
MFIIYEKLNKCVTYAYYGTPECGEYRIYF